MATHTSYVRGPESTAYLVCILQALTVLIAFPIMSPWWYRVLPCCLLRVLSWWHFFKKERLGSLSYVLCYALMLVYKLSAIRLEFLYFKSASSENIGIPKPPLFMGSDMRIRSAGLQRWPPLIAGMNSWVIINTKLGATSNFGLKVMACTCLPIICCHFYRVLYLPFFVFVFRYFYL